MIAFSQSCWWLFSHWLTYTLTLLKQLLRGFSNLANRLSKLVGNWLFQFISDGDWLNNISACHDIDQWPPPQPGITFNLPLMGSVVQCRIPSHYDIPNYQKPLLLDAKEAYYFYDVDFGLIAHFQSTHLAPTLLPTVHEPQLFEWE